MGAAEAKKRSEVSSSEASLVQISPTDPKWDDINKFLQGSTRGYRPDRGPYKLAKVWTIRPCLRLQEYEARAKKLGKPTRLCHGTLLSSAKAIARQGFTLPEHAGLYGKGIYFAKDPRKSASYAPESSWSPFFNRWKLLLCDVYLGRWKTLTSSRDIDPTTDLKGGYLRNMFSRGDYNSVYVRGSWFSYSEYIVYQVHQALPRYLIEYEYVHT